MGHPDELHEGVCPSDLLDEGPAVQSIADDRPTALGELLRRFCLANADTVWPR